MLLIIKKEKTKIPNNLPKYSKNTVHIHCTNTLKQWVTYQNNQEINVKLSEYIKQSPGLHEMRIIVQVKFLLLTYSFSFLVNKKYYQRGF